MNPEMSVYGTCSGDIDVSQIYAEYHLTICDISMASSLN